MLREILHASEDPQHLSDLFGEICVRMGVPLRRNHQRQVLDSHKILVAAEGANSFDHSFIGAQNLIVEFIVTDVEGVEIKIKPRLSKCNLVWKGLLEVLCSHFVGFPVYK